MNNFFATPEGGWGDGSVHLTTVGIAIVIAVIALLLIVAAIVRHKNATHKSALTTKQLVYSAVAIALAVVCSMIKLFDMPMGGSVTLLSMLFIVLIAYWYGPYVGIMTACSVVYTIRAADTPFACMPTGTPRPLSSTVQEPSASNVTYMVSQAPARCSSTALSTIS